MSWGGTTGWEGRRRAGVERRKQGPMLQKINQQDPCRAQELEPPAGRGGGGGCGKHIRTAPLEAKDRHCPPLHVPPWASWVESSTSSLENDNIRLPLSGHAFWLGDARCPQRVLGAGVHQLQICGHPSFGTSTSLCDLHLLAGFFL